MEENKRTLFNTMLTSFSEQSKARRKTKIKLPYLHFMIYMV